MSTEITRAASISPVLRMLCGEGKPCTVKFSTEYCDKCADGALVIADESIDGIKASFKAYIEANGKKPTAALVEGLGIFKISIPEVAAPRRLQGKIAIVTGSAQGFGKGIAEDMAKEGALVVVADMNADGAKATADELCSTYGEGVAISVGANVTDEDSVKAMVEACVEAFGGLDVLVNNAGIVRAGSLEEMTKANFELVASVNYTAYFLCAKYASAVMKLQRAVRSDYLTDIIEINSKSGLEGSNKNFAYAGSKFGGLGLTQSFALELAPFGIKVNAICPGNFLNGPLWSDPEKGLFVQYLKAGKVPGAKTIDDVRRAYEAKVPLNRGCEPKDVARAIMYLIEQEYETGQALPVTGGQVMLK